MSDDLESAEEFFEHGVEFFNLQKFEEALATFDEAATRYSSPALKNRPELDGIRARLRTNQGKCLLKLGRLDAALEAFAEAAALYAESPALKDRTEWHEKRAGLAWDQGICLRQLDRPDVGETGESW